MRRRGHAVRALKPVLSGYQPHAAASSDAGLLLRSADRPVDATAVAEIAPWRFRAPLSPAETAAVLRRFAPHTPLGLLPRLPDSDEFWRHAPDLAFLLGAPT